MQLYLNDFIFKVLHFNQQFKILNWKGKEIFSGTPFDFDNEENDLMTIEGYNTTISCIRSEDNIIIIEL